MSLTEEQIERIVVAIEKIANNYVPPTPPPGNGDTDPPIDPVEYETVTVTADKAPLREIADTNAKGFPIWGIYGKSNVSKRIIAKKGKVLQVAGGKVKGDGGNYAWPLYSGQIVDGDYLPGDHRLYVLDRMVE